MILKSIPALLITLSSVVNAAPIIIDFEDITFSTPIERGDTKKLSNGYHGLQWSGGWGGNSWVVSIDSDNYFSESFGRDGLVAVSGHNYAWSNAGTDLTIESERKFDLVSLWVRQGYAVWNANLPPSDHAVTFTGFRNGSQAFTSELMLGTTYQNVQLDFRNIDMLLIQNGGSLLVDDIVVDRVKLPEPSSIALIGLALVGLVFNRRRNA